MQLDQERADWLAGLMADQDRTLMLTAWKETMAFDQPEAPGRDPMSDACDCRLERSGGTDPPRADAPRRHPWFSARHYRGR